MGKFVWFMNSPSPARDWPSSHSVNLLRIASGRIGLSAWHHPHGAALKRAMRAKCILDMGLCIPVMGVGATTLYHRVMPVLQRNLL